MNCHIKLSSCQADCVANLTNVCVVNVLGMFPFVSLSLESFGDACMSDHCIFNFDGCIFELCCLYSFVSLSYAACIFVVSLSYAACVFVLSLPVLSVIMPSMLAFCAFQHLAHDASFRYVQMSQYTVALYCSTLKIVLRNAAFNLNGC